MTLISTRNPSCLNFIIKLKFATTISSTTSPNWFLCIQFLLDSDSNPSILHGWTQIHLIPWKSSATISSIVVPDRNPNLIYLFNHHHHNSENLIQSEPMSWFTLCSVPMSISYLNLSIAFDYHQRNNHSSIPSICTLIETYIKPNLLIHCISSHQYQIHHRTSTERTRSVSFFVYSGNTNNF